MVGLSGESIISTSWPDEEEEVQDAPKAGVLWVFGFQGDPREGPESELRLGEDEELRAPRRLEAAKLMGLEVEGLKAGNGEAP